MISKRPQWVEDSEADIDRFWEEAQLGLVGYKSGFASIDRAFDLIQPGFHLIGGDSNVGKSSFVCQLAYQLAVNNKDLFILDLSLDDPKRDRICRYLAQTGRIMINCTKKPNDYAERFPSMVGRLPETIAKLKAISDRLQIYDSSSMGNAVEDLGDLIRKRYLDLQSLPIPQNLAVILDNFHDLSTHHPSANNSDKAKYSYIAQYVSDLAIECDIPIICTAEYRKMNGFRRPIVDDIREAVKIKYEAKSIILTHSDVACREEMAGVYFEVDGNLGKKPVLEAHVAKNKYSSYKGRLFFEFYPELAYFEEPDEESQARYRQAVYSSE